MEDQAMAIRIAAGLNITPEELDKWRNLSEAQRQQLAAGGLLPPGIFEAEAWGDSTEADPEDIIH